MYFNIALWSLICMYCESAQKWDELTLSWINSIVPLPHNRSSRLPWKSTGRLPSSEPNSFKIVETRPRTENPVFYTNPYTISNVKRQCLSEFPITCRADRNNIQEIIESDEVTGYNLNKNDTNFLLVHSFKNFKYRVRIEVCEDTRRPDCRNITYPSIDGSCNNLVRSNEGRSFSCISRLLPPDYIDERKPRISKCRLLPDPEKIASEFRTYEECKNVSSTISTMLSIFGQFVDHDIVFASRLKGSRELMNNVTAAIDASQVYGSNSIHSEYMRAWDKTGKLATSATNLPLEFPDENINCNDRFPCFLTGDLSWKHNLQVASLHVTFFRMHNLIADNLKVLNPDWEEETLFQESRMINIYILQNIIFKEYLPLILGPELLTDYRLNEDDTEYDSSIRLRILNPFATASVILHTTVPVNNHLYAISENGELSILKTNRIYFDMQYIYRNGPENIIRGATRQYQNIDPFIFKASEPIMEGPPYHRLNVKVASAHIQLGREIRLPGYVYYVLYLHGIRIKNFNDLQYYKFMDKANARKLSTLYNCVEDIDLFVGMSCEIHLPGRFIGPTAAKIIALQFHRLKFGDRYFYTHEGILKPEQKEFISRIKLSHVFCYVYKMPQIAEDVFIAKSPTIPCDSIAPLDFTKLKGMMYENKMRNIHL